MYFTRFLDPNAKAAVYLSTIAYPKEIQDLKIVVLKASTSVQAGFCYNLRSNHQQTSGHAPVKTMHLCGAKQVETVSIGLLPTETVSCK